MQEVSELVHRRLVTSALDGEFRNVLELHVRVCFHSEVMLVYTQERYIDLSLRFQVFKLTLFMKIYCTEG